MRSRLLQKNGYRKNATVLLLTVAFLFGRGGIAVPAASAEAHGGTAAKVYEDTAAKIYGEVSAKVYGGFSAEKAVAGAGAAASADPAALLSEGLTACAEVIDLRDASLSPAGLGQLYAALLLDSPALFHVAPRLSYGYAEEVVNGVPVRTVTEVYPVYTLTGAGLTAARALYRETVAAILTEMEAVFGDRPRTEADTVLYLHDLLADRYAYDPRPEGEANADAFRFFRDGTGLCQAYALAFTALCLGAGLEAHTVVSDAMDHAWNHVRVEGAWYHVDVTRDDPIPAEGGHPTVGHTRLLRSDRGMEALGYRDYTCAGEHACTDTRFEATDGGAALEAFTQSLRFWGGVWMGMDDSGGIVAAKIQKEGVFIGQVGDTNLNGVFDPADLLGVYDVSLPEAWREWMRTALTKGT